MPPFSSYTSEMAPQTNAGKLSTLETVLRLQGLFRHRLQALEVSPVEAGMLLYLDRHPQCKLVEIASALCIEHPSMVETIQLSQRKGWLHKTQTHKNRRTLLLRLTVKGRALARKIRQNIEVTDRLFSLVHSRKAA
ncbi:MAG: MarR family transcriptional regulator [Nitrospira sp.]